MQQLDRLGKVIQVLETIAKENLATIASKIHKIVDDFNNTVQLLEWSGTCLT